MSAEKVASCTIRGRECCLSQSHLMDLVARGEPSLLPRCLGWVTRGQGQGRAGIRLKDSPPLYCVRYLASDFFSQLHLASSHKSRRVYVQFFACHSSQAMHGCEPVMQTGPGPKQGTRQIEDCIARHWLDAAGCGHERRTPPAATSGGNLEPREATSPFHVN